MLGVVVQIETVMGVVVLIEAVVGVMVMIEAVVGVVEMLEAIALAGSVFDKEVALPLLWGTTTSAGGCRMLKARRNASRFIGMLKSLTKKIAMCRLQLAVFKRQKIVCYSPLSSRQSLSAIFCYSATFEAQTAKREV